MVAVQIEVRVGEGGPIDKVLLRALQVARGALGTRFATLPCVRASSQDAVAPDWNTVVPWHSFITMRVIII